MNYIYDIYVNFQKQCYDFYEWNKKDRLSHIKKIPLFKINDQTLKNIIKNDNKVDLHFFETIKNRTEIFNLKNKITACLLTNNKDIIAVQISHNGIIIKKSFLLPEEEYDILKATVNITLTELKIEKIKTGNLIFLTRNEIERNRYILRNISNMDDNKLFYLYFECFNKEINDRKTVENEIKYEILNNNDKICSISYNFLKLIYT